MFLFFSTFLHPQKSYRIRLFDTKKQAAFDGRLFPLLIHKTK